jgi:hypothetical protein
MSHAFQSLRVWVRASGSDMSRTSLIFAAAMAGLVPAIHVFEVTLRKKFVDAGHKAGHD